MKGPDEWQALTEDTMRRYGLDPKDAPKPISQNELTEPRVTRIPWQGPVEAPETGASRPFTAQEQKWADKLDAAVAREAARCTHESGWFTIQLDGGFIPGAANQVRFGDFVATKLQWCRECGSVRVGDRWIAPDRSELR